MYITYLVLSCNIDGLKKNHKQFIKNNESILKTQQRFKSERHNVFTEEIDKIALNSNGFKSLMYITYSDLSCKLATNFSTFSIFILSGKNGNSL